MILNSFWLEGCGFDELDTPPMVFSYPTVAYPTVDLTSREAAEWLATHGPLAVAAGVSGWPEWARQG